MIVPRDEVQLNRDANRLENQFFLTVPISLHSPVKKIFQEHFFV